MVELTLSEIAGQLVLTKLDGSRLNFSPETQADHIAPPRINLKEARAPTLNRLVQNGVDPQGMNVPTFNITSARSLRDLIILTQHVFFELLGTLFYKVIFEISAMLDLMKRRPGTPAAALPTCPDPQLAWHRDRHRLAASVNNTVLVYNTAGEQLPEEQLLFEDPLQTGVSSVSWRPASASTMAVACNRGVIVWSLKLPRGELEDEAWALSRGRYKMALLQHPGHFPTRDLDWSPCGKYLVSCSAKSSTTMVVWNVATGEATPLRASLGGIYLVRWSPCGSYVFAAFSTGQFMVLETHTWTHEKWGSVGDGCVKHACWGPSKATPTLLLALDKPVGGVQVLSLQFSSPAPLLNAHLLPLPLKEIDVEGSELRVTKIAWDLTGSRLALLLGGGHARAGQVALYATKTLPVLAGHFIGFITGHIPMIPSGEDL
ncbi:hypothetical protein CYMTET_54852 [Cymbomonas tetramitiformis]|uniref:Aladin seven-bladed propeller domain-containing protein n=1 Tax=Cymbomonas tetramitiformis TaxID=36881 RepID=A0AAE0BFH7_9CHLO|nr:hypothetical protein CYMTET_54852 [Cymbomonas tetramitiformis]